MVRAACSRWRQLLPVAVVLLGLSLPVAAAPLGTSLTYQGVLMVGGVPADGTYDLRFTAWDAAAGGSSVGTVTVDDLAVSGGVVNAQLDFGDLYDGTALWLEVEVRDGASSDPYDVVSPRQPLRPLPQGLYARTAGHAHFAPHAATAGDVKDIDGVDAAGLRAFSGLTGIPADLADGDQDLLAVLGCTAGDNVVWGSGTWTCGLDHGGWRTLTVEPVGDATANGAALLAAMEALPAAASLDEAWRLRLEPGRYDLGSASLVVKPWAVLQGAGESGTVVTSAHCTPSGGESATVVAGDNSTISSLTVENTCTSGTDNGVAIRLPATTTSASIEHVTARATGSPMYAAGVVSGAAGAWLHRITADASGGTSVNTAFTLVANTILTDSTGSASGGSIAVGLAIGSPSEATPANAVVNRGTFTASGATTTRGLQVSSAQVDLARVTVSGAEGLVVFGDFGDTEVHASRLTSTGPVAVTRNSGGDLVVTVEQSRIVASGAAVTASGLSSVIRVAATQLWGGAPSTAATCAGVWDENWVFYPSTCP